MADSNYIGVKKLLDPDLKIQNLMERPESIVILPNNTLRFIDLPLQVELYNISETNSNLTMAQLMYRLTCRKEKSLAKLNDVDESDLTELKKLNYPFYYTAAPATELYTMLSLLAHQKFTAKITALFDDTDVAEDDGFCNTEYFDGTYRGLVNYLKNSDFTCLVIDDIDLLDQLTKEPTLDFNYKTIIISRLGYNYYTDKNGCLLLRKYEDIKERYLMDIYTFCLFQFTEEDKVGGII